MYLKMSKRKTLAFLIIQSFSTSLY